MNTEFSWKHATEQIWLRIFPFASFLISDSYSTQNGFRGIKYDEKDLSDKLLVIYLSIDKAIYTELYSIDND